MKKRQLFHDDTGRFHRLTCNIQHLTLKLFHFCILAESFADEFQTLVLLCSHSLRGQKANKRENKTKMLNTNNLLLPFSKRQIKFPFKTSCKQMQILAPCFTLNTAENDNFYALLAHFATPKAHRVERGIHLTCYMSDNIIKGPMFNTYRDLLA